MQKQQLLWLVLSLFPFSEGAYGAEEKSLAEAPQISSQELMPSIRRIGLKLTKTNIQEFLQFMKNEASDVHGYAAIPLSPSQMEQELSQLLGKKIGESGRFWLMSLDTILKSMSQASKNGVELQRQMEHFEKDYELSAWFEPEIRFSPDNTLIRVVVKSVPRPEVIIAREDILLPPMPTLHELERAFSSVIKRVVNGIKHDGRIVYTRNDITVVDFGFERGLTTHEILNAGIIELDAVHPVSKEYIRTERIKAMELEVLEVRKGSSLCRIIREDKVAEQEIARIQKEINPNLDPTYLVWKSDKAPDYHNPDVKEFHGTDLIGGAENGFGASLGIPQHQEVVSEAKSQTPQPAQPVSENKEEEKLPFQEQKDIKNEKDVQGKLWERFKEASLGIGMSKGILTGKEASANSGIPNTFFNTAFGRVSLPLYAKFEVHPSLEYQYYNANTFQANKTNLNIPVMYKVAELNLSATASSSVFFGSGVLITMGSAKATVKTSSANISLTQDFTAIDVPIAAEFRAEIPKLGSVELGADVASLSLIRGKGLEMEMDLGVVPSGILDLPLGISIQVSQGPDLWTRYGVRIFWHFLKE